MAKNLAWTPVIASSKGVSLGIAERDVAGYSPMRDPMYFATWDEARKVADVMNARMGLSEKEAEDIVISSMAAQNRGR